METVFTELLHVKATMAVLVIKQNVNTMWVLKPLIV